jgi:hypothetical protein
MISRPWRRRLFGFHSQRQTSFRNLRRSRPHVEILEDRLAPADFRVTVERQSAPHPSLTLPAHRSCFDRHKGTVAYTSGARGEG